MDKKLVIDNKKYLSSIYAGKISGYTNDYIARLARQRKILGKKIGKTWYIEECSLQDFIKGNKIQKRNFTKNYLIKRVSDLKSAERDRKVSEVFEAFKSKTSEVLKTELFKKSFAFTVAVTFVFGGYFASNTDIAKVGLRKISQIVATSLDAVSKFDPAKFSATSIFAIKSAGEDVALNVHKGMNKTKPLALQISKNTYLLARGDNDAWKDLKNNLASAINNSLASINSGIRNTATRSLASVMNIFTSYNDLQNIRANVFASIVGNIKSTIKDEALYVNRTINSVLCGKFSELGVCGNNLEDIVLVKMDGDKTAEEKENIVKKDTQEKAIVVNETLKTIINQPVIERIVQTERVLTVSGVTPEQLNEAIQQSQNKLYSDMYSLTSTNAGNIINNYQVIGQTNKIDKLGSVTISNSTIQSSSFSGTSGSFSGLLTASGGLTASSGNISGALTVSGNLTVDTSTLYVDSTNNRVGIGTTSPYATLSVAGNGVFDGALTFSSFIATSTTATSTIAGQLGVTFTPVIPHSFGAWVVDVSGAEPTNASLYINPSSAGVDTNLFALAVNGNAKFLIDAEGDVFARSVTAVGGTTLSTTTAATFTVEGNTTLGDATTTDITYFNSRIGSSLIPTADNILDIGSPSPQLMWRTGYFGTSIGIGTTSPYRTLSVAGSGVFTGGDALMSTLTATSTATAANFVASSASATSTFAGGITIAGQCVTADTKLRRRRRRRKDETDEDIENSEATSWDEKYVYEEVKIVNIKEDDEIQSFDKKTGKLVWSRVNKLMYMGVKQTYTLKTSSGRTICTTANHPYLTENGWTKVSDLKEGMSVAAPNKKTEAKKTESRRIY